MNQVEQCADNKKKAILVVSFGTSYRETLKLNIESTENRIRDAFPDYEVRRAFTSRTVIKRLAERDGIQIDTEKQALDRLQADGFQEVYIQPLHVVPGEEYEKVKVLVTHYTHAKLTVFEKIRIGRPLVFYMGQEGKPDDYLIAIDAIKQQLPESGADSAFVFMGHGGLHPANAAYAVLQLKLEEAGLDNAFVYTVEGFPELSHVIEKLKKNQVRRVTLMPFLLVAGDHATNDMAGDDKDSAKSQLLEAGLTVDVYFHGLGENTAIQDIYVQHLKDAINYQPSGHKGHGH
ncbi:sirohydrochlorin cobaltochelatase [Sporomusa sp.]|uniref:sirohydrochlorin cobaltochelatase n=1 Tax=Sporomusa sp. TaxID=2078658 RepID=UPI002C9AC793|nr:sirohydrochlorin cobaltochelatase [Sporomusa sp.]HWR44887.1 sirohydrochlorin cobaltochelatase [Sporomusa sp.]